MPPVPQSFPHAIRDPIPELRMAAMAGAMKPGAALPAAADVAPALQDADPRVRHLAAVLLGRMGPPAVSALVQALDEKQPVAVRSTAASGLAQAGAAAAPGADALGRCLASPDETLRVNAALALSRIGAAGLPALRRGLASDLSTPASARGIALLGRDGSPAADDLKRASGSGSGGARIASLAALVAVTGDPARGLPALTEFARNSDAAVRASAIERIGELRDLGRGAIPLLRTSLDDAASSVRAAAALALARVGSVEPETAAALNRKLSDPVGDVRMLSAVALERFGPAGAPALPALRGLAGDPDKRVSAAAEMAIRSISPSPPQPSQPSPPARPGASPAGVRR